ncbi:MAG: bacterial Ig-like domain-containing protein, partial [Eubacterium sp.]
VMVKLPETEKTASFGIIVKAKKVTEIAMNPVPTKTEYIAGIDNTLDVTGGKIQVTYDNGNSEAVDLTQEMCSAVDFTKLGEQTVKVNYNGKETSFNINIRKEIEKLEVTAPNKLEYVEGQKFDVTGGKVKLIYTDKSEEIADLTEAMCTGLNMSNPGAYPITVSFQNKTVEKAFTVTVIAKKIESASFTPPTSDQTSYLEGKKDQHLDLTGSNWNITYNDGSTAVMETTEAMCSGYNFETAGEQTVMVKLPETEKTASFGIIVQQKSIIEIAMNPVPTKTQYIAGIDKAIDVMGGQIKIDYNDGSYENIDLTDAMCSKVDFTMSGEKTIIVTYEGKQTSFDIIVKSQLSNISWNKKPNTIFNQGDVFKVDGTIDLTYSDGFVKENVPVTEAMCLGYDLGKLGKQNITVTYNQVSTDVFLEGKATLDYEIGVSGITIKTKPTKTTYKVNESFDGKGLSVIFYNAVDGTENVMDYSTKMLKVEGFDSSKEGKQTLSITYIDEEGATHRLANAFEVTIEKQIPTTPNKPNTDKTINDGAGNNSTQIVSKNPITGFVSSFGGIITVLMVVCVVTVISLKAVRAYKK